MVYLINIMNTVFYARSRTKPFGSNAEECVTCLNLLDRFCRGANLNAPSLILAFFSLGMQPSRKQRSHSAVETSHAAVYLDESSRLLSHKEKKKKKGGTEFTKWG